MLGIFILPFLLDILFHMKEYHENMTSFLDKIKSGKNIWCISADLKDFKLFTTHETLLFYCVSGTDENEIVLPAPVERDKIFSPLWHIKRGWMENFVKVTNNESTWLPIPQAKIYQYDRCKLIY